MEYQNFEKVKQVATYVEAFIEEDVLPCEREVLANDERIPTEKIEELWDPVKDCNLFAPQMSEEYGGWGRDFRDMLLSFEQVGR